MSTTVEKIIGQQSISDCMKHVQTIVDIWMKDNDIKRWEDIVAPNEFDVVDADYNFEVRTGATKIVLVLHDMPYVIKIPYIGDDDWCEGINYFNGGAYDNDGYDYCENEAYIYDEAVKFDCAQFFVPTQFLMHVEDIPIYIQTKVTGYLRSERPSNEDMYKYASIRNSDTLDDDVGARLLRYYSMTEIAIFLSFIKAFEINDLEAARNGEYVEAFGRYVFWDYSGYKEGNI